MFLVKTLLWIAAPGVSALFLIPVFIGPLPVWLCVAIAVCNPLAAVGFYKVIRKATLRQVIELADSED